MAEAASALATELLRCEGRKKTKGRRWAGPAGGAGQLGRLQVSGPGSLSLSLFLFLILFSILQVCFEFGFETNSIFFASENIFRS